MLIDNDTLLEKSRLLDVKDILLSSSTICENIEIVVFVIRNGDVILYGLPFNEHCPVVRWLPWFDDIKKKICALTLEPSVARWALVACADKSLYLIPVLSLLGFNVKATGILGWQKYDVTKLKSPLPCENDFIPSTVAWFVESKDGITNGHVAVVGSTVGHIIIFCLATANILLRTKVDGRTNSIDVCIRPPQIDVIISNEARHQWRITLKKIENEPKDDNISDKSSEPKINTILRSVTTESDIKQWKMKFRHRNKKPSSLTVECGTQEAINCNPLWHFTVKMENIINTFMNVQTTTCISAKYPSSVLTIEDSILEENMPFPNYFKLCSAHKLPEDSGIIIVTKSLIIFANALLNHIKIISRHLSACEDNSYTNAYLEFIEESLLEEYIFEENERILKIFCTDYFRDRCIVITNQAFYSLKLTTDPRQLVLNYILEKNNLAVAEKISSVFDLNLQEIIREAGDSQLSKGQIKEAVQLYNLTRSGDIHLILMLAVHGHMQELHDALRTCHYSSAYKLHFMNLKLLVSLHQFITLCSPVLRNELKDLLMESGYDEALAVSVLARAGLCSELLFITKMKGLHPITMNVVISIVQHYQLLNISHCKGFWYLISDQSFRDTLLMKPHFFMFHQKLVQKNLPHLSSEIIQKLEALYNPFSVPLRTWVTSLAQGDVPTQVWIQTYILICIHLSLKERKFFIGLIGKVSFRQDWSFVNPKLGICEEKISAGFNHAIIIIDGNAYSWGSASFCRLGNGPTTRLASGPAFIDKFHNIGVTVLSISCGRNHNLAITENGVYSWGNNKYGQLGNGNIIQSSYPTLIDALSNCNIVQIVAGQYHSIALDEKQRVFTWGWGVHGQLGHGNTEDCCFPKIVSLLTKEKIILCAAGQSHSVFLTEKGSVWACGSNAFGQLGTGRNKKSSIPIEVVGLTEKIKMISVGYFHNFAISYNGEIFTWGCSPSWLRTAHSAKRKMKVSLEERKEINAIEESLEYLIPKKVDVSIIKGKIMKIVAGSEHNVLLTDDGTIYTWGRNMEGQLGIKTSVAERHSQSILTPTPISFGSPVTDVTCGYDSTIAVDISGNVWTWGGNYCSMGNKNILASLEGEIVVVNNKNRVIKSPHNLPTIQPLPTLLKIPIEQKLIRKCLKPIIPIVLNGLDWRTRLHYAIETCEKFYNTPQFVNKCLSLGEPEASAKFVQVSGNISSALKITLKSALQRPEAHTLLWRIVSYYFTTIFFPSEAYTEFLTVIITFWEEEKLPFPYLEEIFYNIWEEIAIILGDLFFRIDSKYIHLSLKFSAKFKLKLVEYMVTHRSDNIDCIFDGCTSANEVLAALNKANDYVDVDLDQSKSSTKTIVFKANSMSSNKTDHKPSSK